MVESLPRFFKGRNVIISHRPHRKNNVAVVGCGNLGCENAIKSVQIKKQIGERAGLLILIHADTNYLSRVVNRASKFIPRNNIFPIQINQLHGNGNGKEPEVCLKNFELWHKEVDRQIPNIIAQVNRAGSWCGEFHTGSGGSYPAMMYAMQKLDGVFYKKLIVVGEATDVSSVKNMPELLSWLSKLDDSYKVIYAHNAEHSPNMELIDYANVAVETAITFGTEKKDATDFLGEKNGLAKFTRLQIGFGAIPHKWWKKKMLDYEPTLSTCVNLLQSLKMQKSDTAVVLGEVNSGILETANGLVYGTQRPEVFLKNVRVKMKPWNVIAGRLRSFEPERVPTPNFDKLAELVGFEK